MSLLVILLSILTVASCRTDESLYRTVSVPTHKGEPDLEFYPASDDLQALYSDLTSPHRSKRDVSLAVSPNITTKINHLNDSHTLLIMRWAGEGSDVLLCLARDINYSFYTKSRPSSLYISYDYGDTFVNKTDHLVLPDGRPAVVDKFCTHPKVINLLVLTDPVNQVLFVSENSGVTLNTYKLEFHPTEIVFHTDNPLIFLARDKIDPLKKLWLTTDCGKSWTMIQESVKSFHWSANYDSSMYGDGIAGSDTGHLYIERLEPSGASNLLVSTDFHNTRVLFNSIEDFWVKGDYMFITKQSSIQDQGLDLFLSYKGGRFTRAEFFTELNRLRYHVEVSGPQVMVVVGHKSNLANLYVSTSDGYNAEGMKFALSLESVFCFFPNFTWKDNWLDDMKEESFADIHEVNGLRGIYIASVVVGSPTRVGPENLQTVITFDRGGEWRPLTPPKTDDEGQPLNCDWKQNCSLHLSHKFSHVFPSIRTQPILSSKSAPGVILASGTVGQSLKGHPGIFLSTDAGVTWRQILKGSFLFNFGDHGGVIVAVKSFKSKESKELWYSTDMGNSFKVYNFVNTSLYLYALMTEPGENTTVFTTFGSLPEEHKWIIVTVDLKNAFERSCTEADYKHWSPGFGSSVRVPCLLGKRETYLKRKPMSRCYSVKNYDRPVKMEDCECDEEDFECDSGFIRDIEKRQCLPDKNVVVYKPYDVPRNCPPGTFYNRTKGYRKIPGDSCFDGKQDRFLPLSVPCPIKETKEFLLYARQGQIVRVNLGTNSTQELPISNARSIVALEFDMKNNCVYWSDSLLDIIQRQCLDPPKGSQPAVGSEILLRGSLPSVEGMALDWVSNLLFFVDGAERYIDAIRIDVSHMGRMRRTIHGPQVLFKPRGIAVHPRAGYLFWTDWSSEAASVSRSNLDGSDRRALFKKPDVHWPNGLAIDHYSERLYWVDAQEDYIAWSDLDGRKMFKIIQNEDKVSHPFAVAVFKDYIYWDDWKENAIFMADKDHGAGIQAIATKKINLKDIKVFAHGMQEGTNACANKTLCAYICVGGPKHTYTCLCPNGLDMRNGVCVCPNGEKPLADGTCSRTNNTCAPNFFSCGSKCIPESWKCDGEDDCIDGRDEAQCAEGLECDANMFRCENEGKCIPKHFVCDNDKDCLDGSDEKNCRPQNCTAEEFKCNDGQCIPKEMKCDGDLDCRDGTDEDNCFNSSRRHCAYNEIACENSTRCIPRAWKCDGREDCPNGSDEKDCANVTCGPEYFRCNDGRCMFKSWQCDGQPDCQDGSDEFNCTIAITTKAPPSENPFSWPANSTCRRWMLPCQDGTCIPLWWRCDGNKDCGDGSDELGCDIPKDDTDSDSGEFEIPPPPTERCSDLFFTCTSGQCIPDAWVCDKINDCAGGEDELHCDGTRGCSADEFKCMVDGSCINNKNICDGVRNCPDGSDERNCQHRDNNTNTVNFTCDSGFYPCRDGLCLPAAKFCDGRDDCYDGLDEVRCNGTLTNPQVLFMAVERTQISSTSIKIHYKVPGAGNTSLEYLPSISEVAPDTSDAAYLKETWQNHTQWINKTEFVFTDLHPGSEYNMTVYARKKGSAFVVPTAVFVRASTQETRPKPPSNVTAQLVNATCVKVSWQPPSEPNGKLVSYTVFMRPPLPPLQPLSKKLMSGITTWHFFSVFKSNTTYTFWVTASNSFAESANSDIAYLSVRQILKGPDDFRVTDVSENSLRLTWTSLEGVQSYEVRYEAPAIRVPAPPITVADTSVVVNGLAPGETYDFFVKAIGKDYHGSESMVTTSTKGYRLATVTNITVYHSGSFMGVRWNPVTDKRSDHWTYGVYFLEDRSYSLHMKTDNTTAVLDNAPFCKKYLVAVGLVGPLGVGPLSNPVIVFTGMDVNAPPRKLKVQQAYASPLLMHVSWEASCRPVGYNISYLITVQDLTQNRVTHVTTLETDEAAPSHSFWIRAGAVYNVTVKTNRQDAQIAGPFTFEAPVIPAPTQIQIEPQFESYKIYWQQHTIEELLNVTYYFEVLVSEGPTLDENKAHKYIAHFSPFSLTDVKEGTIYSVAIRLVTHDGYKSSLSKVHSITVPKGSWSAPYSGGTSKGVYYVAIPAVILVLGLGAALTYYVVRHRRLQQNFELFANSHYDTRSGAATFGGAEELEEDDSPVIRGFSDDEPMVMA